MWWSTKPNLWRDRQKLDGRKSRCLLRHTFISGFLLLSQPLKFILVSTTQNIDIVHLKLVEGQARGDGAQHQDYGSDHSMEPKHYIYMDEFIKLEVDL